MKYYSIVLGSLMLAIGAGVPGERSASRFDASSFNRAIADLNIAQPMGLTSGCVGCPLCGPMTPGGPHDLSSTGQLQVYPGDPHFGQCIPHNCMEYHYFDFECSGEALSSEEQRAVWIVATGQDAKAIVKAMEQYPESLKLNLDRSSLQIYNCIGEIAASIPLHPARLAELRSVLSQ